ncbi:hypothetical protein JRI60_05250 [Archangium violaceum]|uniref:hypothetical protein n=1 Tax=Archangium violaceum TaxID=83451 RepID=UPI00194F21C5|nr:hypothetical protein [Archangium violaceum]QRN98464.1 hypothetical protein JRI60_05250 [Archangium violaceum]
MADKSLWKGGRLGAFHLGRRYKGVGADLGRLYEAHNVRTGVSALVLMPDPRAGWDPAEAWRVSASSQVEPTPHLVLEVEQAPASGQLPELSAMLDLLTSAVEQVETKDEVRTHLTREPIGLWRRWAGRSRRLVRSRWTPVAAGLATVAVGVALWLRIQAPGNQERAASGLGNEDLFLANAPRKIASSDTGTAGIAYPLPSKPFRDQARPPCKAGRSGKSEVEINGGCWVELARRPPCEDDDAEYQGKCYLPVGERAPLPRSIQQ